MIADLGTELHRIFDAQAFATKHGLDAKEVSKVFSVFVQQPLSAFSVRGLSRARMKEFKEKMREHDKRLKEMAPTGTQTATVKGKGKLNTTPTARKPQAHELGQPSRKEVATPAVAQETTNAAPSDPVMG